MGKVWFLIVNFFWSEKNRHKNVDFLWYMYGHHVASSTILFRAFLLAGNFHQHSVLYVLMFPAVAWPFIRANISPLAALKKLCWPSQCCYFPEVNRRCLRSQPQFADDNSCWKVWQMERTASVSSTLIKLLWDCLELFSSWLGTFCSSAECNLESCLFFEEF